MKIRAVTAFMDPGWPIDPGSIRRTSDWLRETKDAIQQAGWEVQTLRLATPPPEEMNSPVPPSERVNLAGELEAEAFVAGIDYAAIGPATAEDLSGFEIIPEILASTQIVFTSAIFADPEFGISRSAATACADVICATSLISPDGFSNLRFAALANVPSGVPFFPASYHRAGPTSIALATEAADLAVSAVQSAPNWGAARTSLVHTIEHSAEALTRIVAPLAQKRGFRFHGIDFSLAPFPTEQQSLGTALERLSGAPAGGWGTTAAAAFLADCLDRARFQRTGFCGLFLPVLEDATLAARAHGPLDIKDLLLYATLCGTGLDTVPLPGNVTSDAITGLLLDLGALALRHHKPLTARLLPIPGKQAGDRVQFDFPYFADSRVMPLEVVDLKSDRISGNWIEIGPYLSG
jgi:uncharacterized protein (UPF0210 family)